MAVRVKLLVSVEGKGGEFIALVNSAFETETPQLLLPIPVARELNFWPPTSEASEFTYDTAGGPTKVWLYREKLRVKVLTNKRASKEVVADLVISPIEDELLISDKLAGELGIVVEDFGKGLWRLRDERELYETERPQIWK